MSEPQSRSRHSPSDNRSSDRGERKRAWRDDGDNEERGRGGGRDDRGPKLMKPGALGMKVLVPNSLVGAIIGKGGEEMKKLKEESNCFIRLSQNDKYFPNTNERPCYVEGVPEDIVKAIKVMQEKLINDNPRRGPSIDDNRKKLCKIIVGSNAAGKTIGKGGENVKRLNSEHSVWVKVMGRDDSIPGLEERTVTISGELENTLKAVQDILEMSAGLTNGGTDKNLDYDHFNMVGGNNFNQGGYGGNNYNQGGNFGNNQQGFNQGGNMGGRSGPPGPNMGRSGSMGPGPNMGPGNQGYNNMGGGPAPSGNNMGPGMGQGGNYNQSGPPVQQYNAQGPPQPSGQYQGNVQQYPPSNNSNNGNNNSGNSSNIPIQQYPGGSGSGPQSGGYGGGQGGGGYNQQQPGYNNQMGGGHFNQGPGGFNSGPGGSNPPGGYNQGQGGYNNQGGGYNSSSQGGYQGGNQGYQGGNQQGGDYQGGNQGGNYQGGRGGFQGGRGGNQSSGGRGNFRGNNRGGNRGGRGARGNSN